MYAQSTKISSSTLDKADEAQRTPQSRTGIRHVPVETWLGTLGLMEYKEIFDKFHGVEDLLLLNESDVLELGVRNHAHRARIVSTITLYKEQIYRKMNQDFPKASLPQSGTPHGLTGISACPGSQSDYATVNVVAPSHTPLNFAQPVVGNVCEHSATKELAQYAWFHGSIPRQKAESLLVKDGDFLVRNSTTKPGDFVLTVLYNGLPMHFVINKKITLLSNENVPLIEYRFEERLFDKPTDLILHYFENKKPITDMSGAIISQPVMRSVPMDYYDSKTASPYQGNSPAGSPWQSPGISPKSSPLLKPKLNRGTRSGSQPILSLDSDADPQLMMRKSSMPSLAPKNLPLCKSHGECMEKETALFCSKDTANSHHALSSNKKGSKAEHLFTASASFTKSAPPKPSRIPTVKRNSPGRPMIQIRNQDLYEDDGRDYSDYDQIKSWPGHLSRSLDSDHDKSGQNSPYDVQKTSKNFLDINMSSSFDLAMYESEILTPNNKPLEPSAVSTIKSLLLESNSKTLAQHLTFLDLTLLKVLGIQDFGLGIKSGLELVTLPHGRRFRQDIIDRYECLSLFVALTILMCSQPIDRMQMLHKWIHIALETRGPLGNMYSFSAIMDGIGLHQISRLKKTWLLLKQQYPESVFIYENRLLSLLSALDNGSATLPLQNITVPHIMPLVRLLERDFTDIHSLLKWEREQADFGIDMVLAHLDTARIITQQCQLYHNTANTIMQNFEPRLDINDLFKTEMHQMLLWGSRGASVNLKERLSKFPAVLDLLSHRVESLEELSVV